MVTDLTLTRLALGYTVFLDNRGSYIRGGSETRWYVTFGFDGEERKIGFDDVASVEDSKDTVRLVRKGREIFEITMIEDTKGYDVMKKLAEVER